MIHPSHAPHVVILLTGLGIAAPSAAAPTKGSHYMVEGRCVTITRVSAAQASYKWKEEFESGSGTLMLSDLTEPCHPGAGPSSARAPLAVPPDAAPEAPPAAADSAPPTDAPSGAAGKAGEAAFVKELLDAHNHYRCLHGVPPLVWSSEVASYAQKWVRGLRGLRHSNAYKSPIGPMGENLYGAAGMQATGAAATKTWYDELAGYDYGGKYSGQTGHFTAMIWKDARYLGCGRAHGIISCNYWSGKKSLDCSVPNMPDCFQQQVPRPIKDAAACK